MYDPSQLYGNQSTEGMMQQHAAAAASYGDYQSAYTSMRASYGNGPQSMLAGMGYGLGQLGGGMYAGAQNMMSDIGGRIMPAGYTPPAMMFPSYGGMYVQQGGFFSSGMRALGATNPPFGATAATFHHYAAEDFGERIGGGLIAGGLMTAGTAFGLTAGASVATYAGSAVGAALLGGPGAWMGGLAGGLFGGVALGGFLADQVQQGVNVRRDIQNYVDAAGFRFATASGSMTDPRTGRGFAREGRQQIADFVRELDVKDPTLDTGQLADILRTSGDLGLFTGATDVESFKSKFKSIVENVKVVAKTLHTTLEEGLRTIKELKTVGIEGTGVFDTVMLADTMGKVAGRTGREMLQIGLQGAELFRGTGVSMDIGVQSNIMNLSAIRAARDAGTLSSEAIAQAGGEEAFAQRMSASGLAFGQSAFGRGFGAAFFNGSGLDPAAFMAAAAGGGGNFYDMARGAAQNLGSPGALVSYTAGQEKILSQMGSAMGGTGLQRAQDMAAMSMAERLVASSPGMKTEDALRFVYKTQMGLGQVEIDGRIAMINNAAGSFAASQKAAGQSANERAIDEAEKNTLLYRASDKVGDVLTRGVDFFASPINRFGNFVQEGAVSTLEGMKGIERADVSDVGYNILRGRGRAAAGGPVDLSTEGVLAVDTGNAIARMVESGFLGKTFKDSIITDPSQMGVILRQNRFSGARTDPWGRSDSLAVPQTQGMTSAEFKRALAVADKLDVSGMRAKEMAAAGAFKDIEAEIGAVGFEQRLWRGDFDMAKTSAQLVEAMYGKDVSELSKEQVAFVRFKAEGLGLADIFDASRNEIAGAGSAMTMKRVKELQRAKGEFASLRDQAGSYLDELGVESFGGGFGAGVLEQASVAQSLIGEARAARQAGDTGRAKALEAEADRRLAGAFDAQLRFDKGADKAGVRAGLRLFASGQSAKLASLGERIRGVGGSIADMQLGSGSDVLLSAIRSDLYRGGGLELSSTDRSRVIEIAAAATSSLGGMLALSPEEKALLGKTGTGAAMVGVQKNFSELQKLAESGGSVKQAAAQLKFLPEDKLASVLQTWEGDRSSAVQQAFATYTSGFAQDTVAAGPTAVGGRERDSGSAAADYAQQTAINALTLQALSALATKLRAGQ